jgi:glutamate-1-semialdehyde 2,1-aminomutase
MKMHAEFTSQEASSRSWRVFPAGSNGEFGLPEELSVVLRRGEGCRVWDVTGREFLDFTMGWGSVLLGHGHSGITAAVIGQAPLGANFAHVNEQSLALAERLVELSPACEQVRFCASGTEATMHCLRLARAFRRRSGILKFEGAYHGSHDVGTTSLFGRDFRRYPEPEPLGGSMPVGERDVMLVAPFNDAELSTELIAAHAERLAAVICEPVHRCLPPEPGFLAAIREACTRHGVLLIFDEVVTGFRLALGGAQERYGVMPDLVAYGKAIGGGYPLGVYGGRGDIMSFVEERRITGTDYVWTASTLGGNPVSSAAGLAVLDAVSEPDFYDTLHASGAFLREGMRSCLADAGREACVIGDGPLAQVVFRQGPVRSSREIWQGDPAAGRRMMLGLFERGIFLNPMGTKLYLSAAHDREACEDFLDRFADALDGIG